MSGNIGKCALKMSSKAISMDNVTCIKLWVYLKQFPQTAMKYLEVKGHYVYNFQMVQKNKGCEYMHMYRDKANVVTC